MTRWLLFLTTLLLACAALPTIGWSAEEAGGHAAPNIGEDLALWSLVAFVVFFAMCLKMLGPWAVKSLAEREQMENAFIEEAEQKNRRSQETLSEHRGRMEAISEEIAERIAEAHRDAEHTQGDIATVARREAELLRNRSISEIDRTRIQALNDLFSTMASRVVGQTEVKLKELVDDHEHDRLIDEALNHFESV